MAVGSDRVAPGSGRRQLTRISGQTSLAAGAGVLTGLAVQLALAGRFGAGPATDAFFVAGRLPLAFVQILAVIATQVLVPTATAWLVRDGHPRALTRWTTLVAGALLLGVTITGVAWLGRGAIVGIMAPGLDTATAALASTMVGTMFLMVPATAVAELWRALLNAHHRFVGPAAAHVVLNVVAIGTILLWPADDIRAAAYGYAGGAVCQALVLALLARRHGLRLSRHLAAPDTEVTSMLRRCPRPVAGAAIVPLVRVVETALASYLVPGSIALLNYALLMVNALGGTVFFRSVIVTTMPRLAEATATHDDVQLRRSIRHGVDLMLLVSLPLTAFTLVLAQPLMRALFGIGRLSAGEASLLGILLAIYSTSFVAVAVQRALLAPFYAWHDTRTPFRNALLGAVVNVLVLVAVVPSLDRSAAGLYAVAVAYVGAQYTNLVHAGWRLRGAVALDPGPTRRLGFHLLLASSASAIAMTAAGHVMRLADRAARVDILFACVAVGLIGMMILGIAMGALRPQDGRALLGLVRDRLPLRRSGGAY